LIPFHNPELVRTIICYLKDLAAVWGLIFRMYPQTFSHCIDQFPD
jgi:hypothetical protein